MFLPKENERFEEGGAVYIYGVGTVDSGHSFLMKHKDRKELERKGILTENYYPH